MFRERKTLTKTLFTKARWNDGWKNNLKLHFQSIYPLIIIILIITINRIIKFFIFFFHHHHHVNDGGLWFFEMTQNWARKFYDVHINLYDRESEPQIYYIWSIIINYQSSSSRKKRRKFWFVYKQKNSVPSH